MANQSFLRKMLSRRSQSKSCASSPERATSSKSFKGWSSKRNGKLSTTPTLESVLPGQVTDDSDISESEASTRPPSPERPRSSSMALDDEIMHMHWEEALAGRDVTSLSLEEVCELVDVGMPLKHRHMLWPHWFAAPDVGDIDALQDAVAEEDAKTIEADIMRTQPLLMTPDNRRILRRVLRAYAAANPTVGYCQGMNNIAAVFVLLGFDEVTSLRGCYHLFQGCCPGYHDRDLAGFRLDGQVLGHLVQRVLPAESLLLLEALDVPISVLASEHFLTLASRSWPLEVTARLWDLILLEGSPAVFASFLALLQLYLPQADGKIDMFDDDEVELVDLFRQNVLRGVTEEPERLLQQVRELIPKLPQGSIDSLRFELAGKKC